MRWSDRFFRLLVRLLPAEHREPYVRDMEATFRAERRQAVAEGHDAHRGWWAAARLWTATVVDICRVAPSEHVEVLRRDLRVAARLMAARPLHSLTAIATLAIGIGANVAMFAVVDRVLLAPLPYRDADRVISVQETSDSGDAGPTGYLSFVDIRERSKSFEAIAATSMTTATLTGDGRDAERVSAMRVSRLYFDVLGATPARGRTFNPSEDAPGPVRQVTIISDTLWRRRFGASTDVIGRTIFIGGLPFTVVGVMPASFADLVSARMYDGAELWTPLGYDPAASFACRTCRHLRVYGRLAPGVSPETAQQDVSAIYRAMEREAPKDYRAAGAKVTPIADVFLAPVRPVLLVIWAGVAMLLVVACGNVASLVLLRASEREQEMAVRVALGVTRGRLARQLLTESVLLAAIAGTLALVPAYFAIQAAALLGPAEMPRIGDVTLGGRAVAVACVLTAIAGLVSGILPAVRLSRGETRDWLRGAGRRGASPAVWRARAVLVSGNVAMTVVLLVGAALLVRSMAGLLAVTPGFDPSNTLTLQISLSGERYRDDDPDVGSARVIGFYDDVLSRIRSLGDVEHAAAISTLPMGAGRDRSGFHIEGRLTSNPAGAPNAHRFAVTPDLFETMRIGLVRGRYLDARDTRRAERVVVIGRRTADELFPGENPIGHRVALGPPTAPMRTIVGVVEDLRHEGLHESAGLQVYVPQAQWVWAETIMTVVARSRTTADALVGPVRQIVREVDAAQPITNVRTYNQVLESALATRRFAVWLFVSFAAAALVLAVVGLYGALGVAVGQRRRELGVRLALGARASSIRNLVLRQGFVPVAAGLSVGLAIAWLSVRALATMVYGVSVRDPGAFAAAATTIVISAAIACAIPAWRASRIDPSDALRGD